ncbi:TonB-dependent receptor [Roseimarinus sediminis]|uniref:TonB-dependent receptor n=1 Tax=Roseimarinus sediminis TaxID=1610899 RepID=UPI003D1C0AE2
MNSLNRLAFFSIFSSLLVLGVGLKAQSYNVYGYVKYEGSSESIPYAYCINLNDQRIFYTNNEGFFSMKSDGPATLVFSFVGCRPDTISIQGLTDTLLMVYLHPHELDEVLITREKLHKQTILGKINVPLSKIVSLPTFAGVPDILKSLTYLPGITNGKEGFSRLYVRGGTAGQNLFLIDDAPLFTTNHALGLVSSINPGAIGNIDLYKGGFPARYGNCSSSILDIRMKEGSRLEHDYKVEVGTLSAGASIGGPIAEGKTSYMVAARATYFDLINLPKRIKYLDELEYQADLQNGISMVSLNAFDINAKLSHQRSASSKQYLNVFTSSDFYSVDNTDWSGADNSGFNHHNFLVSAGSMKNYSAKLFLSTSVAYSLYTNTFFNDIIRKDDEKDEHYKSSDYSKISYLSVKSMADYNFSNKIHCKFGIEGSAYSSKPNIQREFFKQASEILRDTTYGQGFVYRGTNLSAFLELEYQPFHNTSINVGLRTSGFASEGTNYFRLDPRISYKAMLGNNYSVKASYTLNHQFTHLLLSNFRGNPMEVWILSNNKVQPQEVHQLAAGFFGTSPHIDYGIEGFYKKMYKLVEYRFSGIEQSTGNVYDRISSDGQGEAYGLEFFGEKNTGKVKGTISYTLSWSNRTFSDINQGEPFPFTYDYRHVLSLTNSIAIQKGWELASSFRLMSGQAFTLTDGYFAGNDISEPHNLYSSMNGYRLPTYHRLDVMLTHEWESEKGNLEHLRFSIYNVYNQRNASFAHVNRSSGKLVLTSIFGIIPTISYGISF